ncbi:MAG TPA: hypothetical protein VGP64_07485 [Polyangia bacterium]|jgi:hypothetical protein
MRFLATTIPLAALAAFAGVGCGGGGSGSGSGGTSGSLAVDGAVPQVTSGRYQPLSVGSTWVYNVTDTGVAYTKNSQVMSFEDIGGMAAGIMGYKVSETIKTSTQLTWYESTDTDVRRHHDQQMDASGNLSSEDWYTPYDLRVDESPDHLMAGAAWAMSYMDAHASAKKPAATTTINENWTTDAVNEVVTVPAGTFNALKITRTNTADGTAKSQWFTPGVGKIRESNTTGHLEELQSYSIAGGNGGG